MIIWKNNKAGFKGGLNYLIKGFFQAVHSVTSVAPVQDIIPVGLITLLSDDPIGLLTQLSDAPIGLITTLNDNPIGLITTLVPSNTL